MKRKEEISIKNNLLTSKFLKILNVMTSLLTSTWVPKTKWDHLKSSTKSLKKSLFTKLYLLQTNLLLNWARIASMKFSWLRFSKKQTIFLAILEQLWKFLMGRRPLIQSRKKLETLSKRSQQGSMYSFRTTKNSLSMSSNLQRLSSILKWSQIMLILWKLTLIRSLMCSSMKKQKGNHHWLSTISHKS